jgi:hypothetical protein
MFTLSSLLLMLSNPFQNVALFEEVRIRSTQVAVVSNRVALPQEKSPLTRLRSSFQSDTQHGKRGAALFPITDQDAVDGSEEVLFERQKIVPVLILASFLIFFRYLDTNTAREHSG